MRFEIPPSGGSAPAQPAHLEVRGWLLLGAPIGLRPAGLGILLRLAVMAGSLGAILAGWIR